MLAAHFLEGRGAYLQLLSSLRYGKMHVISHILEVQPPGPLPLIHHKHTEV